LLKGLKFYFSQPEKGNCVGLGSFKIRAAVKYQQQKDKTSIGVDSFHALCHFPARLDADNLFNRFNVNLTEV